MTGDLSEEHLYLHFNEHSYVLLTPSIYTVEVFPFSGFGKSCTVLRFSYLLPTCLTASNPPGEYLWQQAPCPGACAGRLRSIMFTFVHGFSDYLLIICFARRFSISIFSLMRIQVLSTSVEHQGGNRYRLCDSIKIFRAAQKPSKQMPMPDVAPQMSKSCCYNKGGNSFCHFIVVDCMGSPELSTLQLPQAGGPEAWGAWYGVPQEFPCRISSWKLLPSIETCPRESLGCITGNPGFPHWQRNTLQIPWDMSL